MGLSDEREFSQLVAPILIAGQAPACEADTKLQNILKFDHTCVRASESTLALGGGRGEPTCGLPLPPEDYAEYTEANY
jgi:hypothetical protein